LLKLIAHRLITFIPVLAIVGVMSFALLFITPGSPGQYLLGDAATPEGVAQIDRELGLNRPFVNQFADWFGKAARGDLGDSILTRQSVRDSIMDRLPATASLAIAALLLALTLGVPMGAAAALRPGRFTDRALSLMSSLGVAIPGFWLGILLANYFVFKLQWFPVLGYTPITENPWLWVKSITLPAVALAAPAAAVFARHMRNQLTDVLQRDYVRTARAKGATQRRVVIHHALKNAASPIVTLAGTSFVGLLGGTVIVEQIFSIPGVGNLAINASYQKDLPIVQGLVVLAAVVVLLVNLSVDIINGILDPRVRTS